MSEERHKHKRAKVSVPVEIHVDGNAAPLHSVTSDISLGGCYLESMYPFPAGTRLELKLPVADTLLIEARVVTCDPQFGNSIAFVKMLREDSDTPARFIDSASPPAGRLGKAVLRTGDQGAQRQVAIAPSSQLMAQYCPYLPLTESSSFFES
jgi:hypothetical protein